jgi:hypothetical protein
VDQLNLWLNEVLAAVVRGAPSDRPSSRHANASATGRAIPSSVREPLARLCDDDDGPGRMNNINKNENPVANALGQPARTAY